MASKTTPYVSVVMTSYNREKYIGQAIDSILAQECKFSFEIIIGDDSSSDGSRLLLAAYQEKYPDVFVLNLHEENVGFGPNWASTVKMARGKYVAFLDDDDYYCYRYNPSSVFHTEVGVNGRPLFDASIYAGSELIKLST